VALPSWLAIGCAGAIVTSVLERQFERRMQEDVEMVARALQKPVSHALERQREGSLRSALESAIDIGRVYGAYLYNESGTPLASIATVEERHQPELADPLRGRRRGGGHYGEIQGEAVYSYYVPVRLGGDRGTGLLRITRRKAEIEEFMERIRAGGVALLLSIAAMTIVIVLVGYRRAAGAAFERLNESIARIREGDWSHRAYATGPLEVRGVVAGLNAMLDSIQEAEARLERSRDERLALKVRLVASEKLASIGRLAAGIAHELGTPLGTVAGRVQRLMRRGDLPAQVDRELEHIEVAVRGMDRLVQEILDFGRREGLRRGRIDARSFLDTVVATLVTDGEVPNGCALELRGEAEVELSVDRSRLEQALKNLLRNAFRASPDGRVRATWTRCGETVRFIVEDDGPGVPEADRARIFEPFFTTRRHGGTGLGLAIVASVVDEHGGHVAVGRSELGGARFELHLPVGETSERERVDAG
jgi:two-component system, NtrC family, sensor kinase